MYILFRSSFSACIRLNISVTSLQLPGKKPQGDGVYSFVSDVGSIDFVRNMARTFNRACSPVAEYNKDDRERARVDLFRLE